MKWVIGGNWDKRYIYIWLKSKKLIIKYRDHSDKVTDVKVSPNGRHLVSGDKYGRILLRSFKDIINNKKQRSTTRR